MNPSVKLPIYPEVKDTLSYALTAARQHVITARDKSVYASKVFNRISGSISALAITIAEVKQMEVTKHSKRLGKPFPFRSCGIGLDSGLCCFMCGKVVRHEGANDYMHNICARTFTWAAENIISWFKEPYSCCTRISLSHGEPDCPQVLVGACDEHIHHLKCLEACTLHYGVLWKYQITWVRTLDAECVMQLLT